MIDLQFKLKAVFFDMDGVLFDSMKFHSAAWVKAMHDMQLPFTSDEAYMNEGRTGASTIDNVFLKELNRQATDDEKQQIYKLKSAYFESFGVTSPMPFASELLCKVRDMNVDIFLVTGSGQPSLLESLNSSFPGIFSKHNMVTAFDVKQGKPHPEPYLMALQKSGYKANEVVVVENAPLGVESATAAGLYTIGVNTGPLNDDILLNSGAAVVLDSMQDLYQNWETIIASIKN